MRKFTPCYAPVVALLMLLACCPAFAGTTYFADPAKGADDGDGSAAKPWKTLETVIKDGKLATLKGGDTLELASGYHGTITFSGENESMVTIKAGKGQRPEISRLTIPSGKNWTVKGLVISPTFGKEPYKGEIVSFADKGESSKITIEDCYVFSAEDSSKWDAQEWMSCNSGINMGREGKDLTLRNCYVKNTRFAIVLCAFDSLCEGNVVSDYSADGIRATRDGLTVQYNVIKNVYVSDADGDKNHDDGIQVFLFNKGTGLVKNMKFIGNLIIAHEDPNQKWRNGMQGLGFFDGPLENFVVTDNVIRVDTFHGISLYNALNARVENNVVWTLPTDKTKAWLMFGTKSKAEKGGNNVAKNNYANSFNFKADKPTEENNQISTEKIYNDAYAKLYKIICDKFGADHFAADRPRIGTKSAEHATKAKASVDKPASSGKAKL